MTTVVFVHGTGVREPHYTAAFGQVKRELQLIRADLAVARCYWGGTCGTILHQDGASIPEYPASMSLGAAFPADYDSALWGLLYNDPYYELRTLALRSGYAVDFVPGSMPPGQLLDEKTRELAPSAKLLDQLEAGDIRELFAEARDAIVMSAAYTEALASAPVGLGEYRAAIARAIVAESMTRRELRQEDARVLTDAALRDEIVRLLTDELGGADMAIPEWVAKQVFGLALQLGAMDRVQRKRAALTNAAFPAAGDILLYQARGDGMRAFIREAVEQAAPPVVLLGHSLGGIAAVDLLIGESIPRVKLVITVGSQAPLLYELNALQSLPYGKPLPEHFPHWLNIYDLRDFLSYIGAGVFPGRVQDVPVDSRQPFPRSHGAYWNTPTTWAAIAGALAAIS
jgi:hypothetical protein